jgi:pyridoxal biosynthesis lyase PdxS
MDVSTAEQARIAEEAGGVCHAIIIRRRPISPFGVHV